MRQFGDTTDAAAQIRALASYGIQARFTSKASFSTLEQQIVAGIPVPCGYLHRGHVSSPAGGGHGLIVVGITPSHVIVHDPLGEADLVNGTTLGGAARFCHCSRANYRCAGLRLRSALDGGRRGQRLGGAGGGVMLPPGVAQIWVSSAHRRHRKLSYSRHAEADAYPAASGSRLVMRQLSDGIPLCRASCSWAARAWIFGCR